MKKYDAKIWKMGAHICMGLFSLLALLPFLLLLIASVTDNEWALANGYSFFPKEWSLEAYKYIVNQWEMLGKSYLVTIVITIAGSTASILLSSMLAYSLSSKRLPGGRFLNFYVLFTMLFQGGQVSSYYIWSSVFHIRDTFFALLLPNLMMSAFNVILFKNYFTVTIPSSLKEAAKIDGCGEMGIFLKIVMPMSLPITATVGLMTGLAYWNDWTNGLYYLSQRNGSKFYTIQLVLNQINDSIAWFTNSSNTTISVNTAALPSTTIRMALAVTAILPIMIIYPFLQKYFVKGITIGAVKE